MNILFGAVLLFCSAILLLQSPDHFLPALLDGGARAATLCVSLIATYCVWMGLIQVWEDSGVARHISRFTKPLARKLFKTDDEEALQAISMNLSVNLLGISGAATPYGIRAATLLDKTENAEYSSAMLFVLNATSIQLIPTSIIGVRVAMHSASPNYVVIPTLLATLLSTFLGIALTRLFIPPHKPAATEKNSFFYPKTVKSRGQV